MYNSFYKVALLSLTVLAFASCDKDFNEIGSTIVGEDHYDVLTKLDVPVEANTIATGPVESRNLPVNPLGVYRNPVFGTTTASFVTQVELSTIPTIDPALHPEVERVYLTVPYFSTLKQTTADGTKIYDLDSIYGPTDGKIDLKVYRSGYYMRNIAYDGDSQESQLFYTNQKADFDAVKVGAPLNNETDPSQNSAFIFRGTEYAITGIDDDTETEPVTTKYAPGMFLTLDKAAFQQAIINAPAGQLSSNNAFRNYFRGLYFKVEPTSTPGQLAMLNFKAGSVTINYKEDRVTDGVTIRVNKTIVLKMAGNTASLLENQNESVYTQGLAQAPGANTRLFLKGGEGSVASIDLFGTEDLNSNNVPDVLDQMRAENWLINEANLIFYVDQEAMATAPEPNRIYLYDITNKRPLFDYNTDGSNGITPKFAKSVFGGILEKQTGANPRGIRYKVRITNYINNLVNKDSTNVRLGVAVTEDINSYSMVQQKTGNPILKNVVPTSSVMNPLGTILYGNAPGVPADKRLKLEIYYTKPE